MSTLTDARIEKEHGKRKQMIEHVSYHSQRSSHDVRHTKTESPNLQYTGVEIAKLSEIDINVAVQAKALTTVVPDDSKIEYRMPRLSCGKAPAIQSKMIGKNVHVGGRVSNGKEAKLKKVAGRGTILASDGVKTSSHLLPLACSHPASKFGEVVSVSRDIPNGCGELANCQPISKIGKGVSVFRKYQQGEPSSLCKRASGTIEANCSNKSKKLPLMDSNKSRSALRIDVGGSRVPKLYSGSDASPIPGIDNPYGESWEVVCRNKMCEVLKQFEELFRKLSEEEKRKPRKEAIHRVDLKAAMLLKDEGKWITAEDRNGRVPGVKIGDQFQYRVELAILGLHRSIFSGIHYEKSLGKSLATSIVMSTGHYQNENISTDEFIYTGEGTNPNFTRHKKPENQKLERGNLALKNSLDAKRAVRVIRGGQLLKVSKIMGMNNGKGSAFTYDGLYAVIKLWLDKDQSNRTVYKFCMRRLPDEPKLPSQIYHKPRKSIIQMKHRTRDDLPQEKKKMLISATKAITDGRTPHCKNKSVSNCCSCLIGSLHCMHCSSASRIKSGIQFKYYAAISSAKPNCQTPSFIQNRSSIFQIPSFMQNQS